MQPCTVVYSASMRSEGSKGFGGQECAGNMSGQGARLRVQPRWACCRCGVRMAAGLGVRRPPCPARSRSRRRPGDEDHGRRSPRQITPGPWLDRLRSMPSGIACGQAMRLGRRPQGVDCLRRRGSLTRATRADRDSTGSRWGRMRLRSGERRRRAQCRCGRPRRRVGFR